jgi:hypothetical protein
MRQKIKLSTKTKAEQLEWRRSKVIEMRSSKHHYQIINIIIGQVS